ncbi:hypothetical protein [Ectobacillus polymachus]|uniref:hypothetical protein n=1 Tax=Ectobacillus polymachus TaxID=1508806 RepID=UPI003A8BA022
MNPNLIEQLKEWRQKHPIPQVKRTRTKPKKKKKELSQRDLLDLMDVNRPTYKRHKGAFRQK